MSNGFVIWATRIWTPSSISETFQRLGDEVGLTLPNSATGRVTALASDPERAGDQIDTSPEEIIRKASADEPSTPFQLWLDDSVDIVCHFRPEGFGGVYLFLVNGVEWADRVRLIDFVVRRTLLEPDNTLGVVADLKGGTADYDWARYLDGEHFALEFLPDLMIVTNPPTACMNIGSPYIMKGPHYFFEFRDPGLSLVQKLSD